MTSLAVPMDELPGRSARAVAPVVPNGQVAMAALIVAELMLFVGLIGAYLVFRLQQDVWPPAGLPRLPVGMTAVNTLVLLASAIALRSGLAEFRRGSSGRAGHRMTLAASLGLTFLVVQGVEWVRLVRHGLTLENVHGGIFYLLIGCHGVHVAAAVVFLAVVAGGVARGRIIPVRPVAAENCATYWYFVTGLWLLLFPLVYLY